MRRFSPTVWLLAPLAIGLLYVAGHALLAPRPSLDDLPPEGAILVQRFRNLDEVDRSSFGPRGPNVRAARELIGDERNLPGLPGVDHTRPVHMILMPRTIRLDSTMAVFGVSNPGAMKQAFDRPDFLERGQTRHAQHLVVNGPWAAVAPNRDDARRMGTGGITAEDLDEDMVIALDVPRLIDHATSLARRFPWEGILGSLGVDVKAGTMRRDEATGELIATFPGVERLQRIGATWKTARMWAWMDQKRLRIDLEPKPGPVVDVLAYWRDDLNTEDAPPRPPDDAAVWLAVPGKQAGPLLAQLVHNAGIDAPLSTMLFFMGDESGRSPDAMTAWGEDAIGTGYALTITLAGSGLPALTDALPMPPDSAESAPLPKGAAPITIGSTVDDRPAPPGEVRVGKDPRGWRLVTFGAGAKRALDRAQAHLLKTRSFQWPARDDEGFEVLAQFGAKADRAAKILGRALKPGGVLACLGGGAIEGSVSTDGRIVRLEARVVR